MKAFVLGFVAILSISGTVASAAAAPSPALSMWSHGTSAPNPPNPLPTGNPNAMWSEPPDLNGLIGSSEQILQYGLETEIANDFVPGIEVMTRATWWGGYYNNTTPCQSGIVTPGFNLEFFQDDNCLPGDLVAYVTIVRFDEEAIGCQSGAYPMYKWSTPLDLDFVAGNRYWFCAQIRNHAFPPQGGRLASAQTIDCDSVFRSVYFGYPNWTAGCGWDVSCDFSQEFEGLAMDPTGACCLSNGRCMITRDADCVAQGGTWQGPGASCYGYYYCPQGACCASDGTCTVTTLAGCRAPSLWQGIGTNCTSATCAPRAPGSVTIWGNCYYSQCVVPMPNSDFRAIAGGTSHALGLRRDGSIACWGSNRHGQCNVPEPNSGFVGIAAGEAHSLGIKSDGSIVAWGWNDAGQCNVPSPDSGFAAAAAGYEFSLGLTRGGSIRAWGANDNHQCDVPAPNAAFTAIAAGRLHGLGLKADGSIVAWGFNAFHQCNVPHPNADFIAIAAGGNYSLGLKADGRIIAWGDNTYGECNVPDPNTGFIGLDAGTDQALGLHRDGSVTMWGHDGAGEFNVPEPNGGFIAVSTGGGTSYALNAYPTVACCRESRVCTMATPDACTAVGGVSLGPGTTCDANPCGTASAGSDASRAAPPLLGASPNPSAGETVIHFALARASAVDLRIYDAAGRLVKGMSLGARPAGQQEIRWDGRDGQGRKVPAGVYLTRITTNDGARIVRLVVIGP